MPIETGTVIEDLDPLWPLSGDFLLEGDNHLRLIKSILKDQFPGVAGQGYAIPIVATEEELNFSQGLTGNIQDQIDALGDTVDGVLNAPFGTVMTFYQDTPPAGWSLITGIDDSMMRVVNALGGQSAGTDSPISLNLDHSHATSDHDLVLAEIPANPHRHHTFVNAIANQTLTADNSPTFDKQVGSTGQDYTIQSNGGVTPSLGLSSSEDGGGGGGSHNHGETELSLGTWEPKYSNMILASKL